jgi:biotin transport system permease protein
MLTLYISQPTWLHTQPAGRKLLILAAASIGLLPISSPTVASVALLGVMALYSSLGGVGLRRLAQSAKALAWLVAFIAGAQVLIASLQGTVDSALLARVAVAMAKLATLVLLAELVTITTPLQALLAAIEPVLRPLERFGLSPQRLALGMGLLIRMATLQRGTWVQLQQAYRARRVSRPGMRLLAPSVRAGLRQADQMAQALNARLPPAGRSHSQSPRLRE